MSSATKRAGTAEKMEKVNGWLQSCSTCFKCVTSASTEKPSSERHCCQLMHFRRPDFSWIIFFYSKSQCIKLTLPLNQELDNPAIHLEGNFLIININKAFEACRCQSQGSREKVIKAGNCGWQNRRIIKGIGNGLVILNLVGNLVIKGIKVRGY